MTNCEPKVNNIADENDPSGGSSLILVPVSNLSIRPRNENVLGRYPEARKSQASRFVRFERERERYHRGSREQPQTARCVSILHYVTPS